MSRRYSWAQVLKELAGAQSTLTRADIRYGRRGDDWHNAQVAAVRRALADAVRRVRALRRGARNIQRRAA